MNLAVWNTAFYGDGSSPSFAIPIIDVFDVVEDLCVVGAVEEDLGEEDDVDCLPSQKILPLPPLVPEIVCFPSHYRHVLAMPITRVLLCLPEDDISLCLHGPHGKKMFRVDVPL